MTRQFGLVLLIAVLTASGARAQRLPVRSYTVSDGLADNTILRIVRDSRGFLWFCTPEGLSRFDGYAFATFGIEQGLPASPTDLLETRRGDYFVGTSNGLFRFDPKGMPMFAMVPWADGGPPYTSIRALLEGHDGTIWVGTNSGLFRVDNTSNPASLRVVEIGIPGMPTWILSLAEDRHGSLWAAGYAGLYRRWPDGTSARYGADTLSGAIQTILVSREGGLWIGTRLNGLFRVAADESHRPPTVDLHFTFPEIPQSMAWQLAQTVDGRIWAATSKGLIVFESEAAAAGRHSQVIGTRNGLPDLQVLALAEDIGGNLWLGVGDSGAARITTGGLTTYGERDGLREVNGLFEDRTGRLCFRGLVPGDPGTNRSVFEGEPVPLVGVEQAGAVVRVGCFDGRRFDAFYPRAIPASDWLAEWVRGHVTLQTRRGDWWVASSNGVYHFPNADGLDSLRSARPLDVYTAGHGLTRNQGNSLFEDSRGFVWISTSQGPELGLSRWNPDVGQMEDLEASAGLPDVTRHKARSFAEDPTGSVWIGFSGELTRYRSGRFVTFDGAHAVPPGEIMAIHVDRAGTPWLASARSGLIRVDDAGTDHPRFKSFTTKDGLSTNNVWVVVSDLAGDIYTGGSRGIDRVNPASGEITHYTIDDGAAPGRLMSAFRDRQGVLWFGTALGLTRLEPSNHPRVASATPAVFIRSVRVDGVPQAVSAVGDHTVSLPDLLPAQNEVVIEYSSLNFSAGQSPRYQVRLGGDERDWGVARADRSIAYANLGPGRHTFFVRVVAADGTIGAEPASVSFTILAPIWQRAWFIVIVVVAAGLLAHVAYRRRVARVLELANMRTRIASDLHDDIGANLTRIALLSDAAPNGNGHDASIGRIARESVGAMADIVWAIKPERESLIDLTRRMRQQADDLFVPRGIDLRFTAPPEEANVKLALDLRGDLLLFFKEAVTNVARHSQCTTVDINLSVNGPRLTLVVTDNGRGFDSGAEYQGQGLRSLQRRATRLGAVLSIASEPGHGTAISLGVPL